MEPKDLLLEEWKQNVVLYVDQDKRGLERIKIFLTVHAGLLALYGIVWKSALDFPTFLLAVIIAIGGLAFTFITIRLSRRAHAYNLLRKAQAMLIEKKLKDLIDKDKSWDPKHVFLTTFTREHVCFKSKDAQFCAVNGHLLTEVEQELSPYAAQPLRLTGPFELSMGHLDWLVWLHRGFYFVWLLLAALVLLGFVAHLYRGARGSL